MFTGIMAVLGMIPGLAKVVDSITGRYYDAKVRITMARLGVDRDVASEVIRASVQESQIAVDRLRVITGSKVLLAVVVAFAIPLVIFFWQCIVYDKIIMDGTHATDPLTGDISEWAKQITWFLFGAPTATTIGHMWLNRKTDK